MKSPRYFQVLFCFLWVTGNAVIAAAVTTKSASQKSARTAPKAGGKTGGGAGKVAGKKVRSVPVDPAPAASQATSRRPARPSRSSTSLQNALDLARNGQYQAAANALFSLARKSEYQSERAQIKYILGLMLMEMKLNQVAAFQFVDVIRLSHPKYTKLAVDKLSVVADDLGDDSLLNYAISRLDVNDIPPGNRDMIWYRIGEVKLKNRDFAGAEKVLDRVQVGSSYYNQALYNRGLAQLEQNRTEDALATFRSLLSMRMRAGVTDTNRVAAQMAVARALYQRQEWDEAIEAYGQVPRDHFLWHDALFEQSWAMMQAARFRSALSNFQSLHSVYYEDRYIPESLLLRAIVYLYICKYDEMEKVLQLFERTYGPVSQKVRDFLRSRDPSTYWADVERGLQIREGRRVSTRLPVLVLNYVLDQGDVRRALSYLQSLSNEKTKIEENASFRSSAIGRYALKVIANRRKNTQLAIGDMVKAHLLNVRTELRDLYEQAGFIRYEMINGRKEILKKKIAGNDVVEEPVDENVSRSFYVQNGFEYYPFQGEYWLDEIGNYHYLGKSSCE